MGAAPGIPLSGWADQQLAGLALSTGARAIADISGDTLLGERAMLSDFAVPGLVAAGRGCRLMEARDGWIALNLARPDDRDMLPALFSDSDLTGHDDDAIAARVANSECLPMVGRGRELGLAIAAVDEAAAAPACEAVVDGVARARGRDAPLVVDLSGLWAGPLAGHLLWLAGARVVKVESLMRPDMMRSGQPAFFALLNQGKDSVALDLHGPAGRLALIRLIDQADIVIEAARPRALLQLGIDATQLVRRTPGLVWITITGHGTGGDAANWIGFGDDCGVAGGLTAAFRQTTGRVGFVGDAIADPLTGLLAARQAWQRWQAGRGGRLILSMSGVVAEALASERQRDPGGLQAMFERWAAAEGQPFPPVPSRSVAPARAFGCDSRDWLQGEAPC